MQKVWLAIIPGLMTLLGGIAIISMIRGPANAGQSAYVGMWRSVDGSGERAQLVKTDKDYSLSVRDAAGNTMFSCSGGCSRNGGLLFTEASSSDGDTGYITVRQSNNRITIEGCGPVPKVFVSELSQ
ncbi:MAG: hypothetical protein NT018_04830 [Armatimonadetes bacterium]|nr:hypothetical protein [Armatimonadota bacterium]